MSLYIFLLTNNSRFNIDNVYMVIMIVFAIKSLQRQLSDDGGAADSRPLYQDMFSAMFDDLQAKFCRGLDLSAESDSFPCWNGTHVSNYTRNLTYFSEVPMLNLIINCYFVNNCLSDS